MNFIELASKRYSVRGYSSKPVEKEKLMRIAEAAVLAPTSVNFQPWKMIIVTDPQLLNKLYDCYHRDWFRTAPACVVAIGDHDRGWRRPSDGKDHTDIDVAIAIDHLILAATEEGLGTCWICNFDVDKCAGLLQLPGHLEPMALIPVGYAENETAPLKKRKEIDNLIIWDNLDLSF